MGRSIAGPKMNGLFEFRDRGFGLIAIHEYPSQQRVCRGKVRI